MLFYVKHVKWNKWYIKILPCKIYFPWLHLLTSYKSRTWVVTKVSCIRLLLYLNKFLCIRQFYIRGNIYRCLFGWTLDKLFVFVLLVIHDIQYMLDRDERHFFPKDISSRDVSPHRIFLPTAFTPKRLFSTPFSYWKGAAFLPKRFFPLDTSTHFSIFMAITS